MPKKTSKRQHIRFHPKASDIANQLGCVAEVQSLKSTFDHLSAMSFALRDCEYFDLLGEEHIAILETCDPQQSARSFWSDINKLLIIVLRTGSRASLSTIDGISWSLGSRNELILALSSRAFIEHAASLFSLTKQLRVHHGYLKESLRAEYRSESVDQTAIQIRRDLVRFALGMRVQIPTDELPSFEASKGEWERYRKSLGNIPEGLQAGKIMNCIDDLSAVQGRQHIRIIYELLCEYCHPNSASRTLDFNAGRTLFGSHVLSADGHDHLSRGFARVCSLWKAVIPKACEAVTESMTFLNDCKKPMPELPPHCDDPTRQVRAVDDHGRLMEIDVAAIHMFRPKQLRELTTEQTQRIQKIYSVLGPPEGTTLDRWVLDFRSEGHHLERELWIFEQFVEVYQSELAERGKIDSGAKTRLYYAIRACYEAEDLWHLRVRYPFVTTLSHFERVFTKTKAIQSKLMAKKW